MPNQTKNRNSPTNNYDPRWFIWTIVFLVVIGVALSTYMTWSDQGTNDSAEFPKHFVKKQ